MLVRWDLWGGCDTRRGTGWIAYLSGCGTGRRSSTGMPSKSPGLQVWSERPLVIAVAAMRASYARPALLRPAERSATATGPNPAPLDRRHYWEALPARAGPRTTPQAHASWRPSPPRPVAVS